MEKIDFVVTWVDSSDPKWIEEYSKYRGIQPQGDKARFRNWDFFKYWFRAVELYAPWVNKVFLVTNGKNPDWINTDHPKLVLVKHSDFIPEKYLPTFNSITIELHLCKIPGLSEQFVYFNDDMYINSIVTPSYYFKNRLPCDFNVETIFNNTRYDPVNRFNIRIQMFCDVSVLNYHFNRKQVVRYSPKKWLGLHLGIKGLFCSLLFTLTNRDYFEGFVIRHTEQPMLKSVLEELWQKESEMMDASCTRFRNDVSLNPYIIRYWQFATGKFYPIKLFFHKVDLSLSNLTLIRKKC